jgi:putative ABC transport system permease protein
MVGPGGSFEIAGSGIPIPERPRAWVNCVSPEYFAALHVPLLAGRDFSWQQDRPGVNRVAMVNDAFRRAYLSGRRAIGTQLEVRWISDLNPDGSTWQIVGVVGDTRQATLDRESIPEIYLPSPQVGMDGGVYVIRARSEARDGLPRAIAQAVAELDPRIQRISVQPLDGFVRDSLHDRAMALRLVGAFAAVAVMLAAVGIYGMVAFRAAARQKEMAIRIAVGADAAHVRGLVFAHGLRLAALGAVLGIPLFLANAELLRAQLYGVQPFDPMTLATVALGIAAVAFAASLVPARRAARTSPSELLRSS